MQGLLAPTFIAGIVLWIVGHGAWNTAGMIMTLVSLGIFLLSLLFLGGFVALLAWLGVNSS